MPRGQAPGTRNIHTERFFEHESHGLNEFICLAEIADSAEIYEVTQIAQIAQIYLSLAESAESAEINQHAEGRSFI